MQLDIHVDGQILPLGWAKVLTKSLLILPCFLEIDKKPEIQLKHPRS